MVLSVTSIKPENARIAGAFKAYLDVISNISATKALGHEWNVLQAKLDIERALLLQWTEKVKLLEDGYDKCLDNLSIHEQIFRLFRNALVVFMDKPQIRFKYQLMCHEQDESLPDSTYLPSSPVLSGPRLEHFNNEFLRLRLRALVIPDGLSSSTNAPYRRVATCASGFDRLVQGVRELVNTLNKFASSPNCLECASQMAKEDVRRCKNMDDMRHVRDAAMGVRDNIAHAAGDLITHLARRRVLRNLWFRGMAERKMNLREPHPDTFEWALKPPAIDADWDDLAEWLVSGSDIYWVCGKAGAGKSTFLKHIFDHPDTRRYLDVWGEDEPVSLGSYFFWTQGTVEQRTREGMARAILFHILSEIPALIPAVLPTMWYHASEGVILESYESLPLPSVPEVRMAFQKLAEPGVLDRKFCFVVDALDEYSGDESRAVAFIQLLCTSSKVKVIASSRPHPVFVDSFADTPKMHLHHLTGGDILQYVQDKVDDHPYMRVLRDVDETLALILIETLAEKASGVFLWGVLGTRALLQGFDAYECMRDLEDRVQAIPEDLPDVYAHMLSLVEPRFREQAAKVLRVCYKSKNSRSAECERGRMWTVGLAAVDDKGMDFDNFELHSERTLGARHRQCLTLEKRLASRCGGLLEVIRSEPDDMDGCFCGTPESHPNHDTLIDSSIEFIHRTAFEWLGGLNSMTVPWAELRDRDFGENAALASLSWQQARVSYELGAPFGRTDISLANCMMNIQNAEKFSPEFANNMMKKIKNLVIDNRLKRGENWHFTFCCKTESAVTERLETLYFAVAMGMVNFVRYYIKENPEGGSMREMELKHGLNWWRVVADRTLICNFLEPHYETIQALSPPGQMLLYLSQIGCPVPRRELNHHVKPEDLASFRNLSIIEEPPH
ncbi:hypothetical protein CEP54_014906 [Fusarium duplospermum]|uniref:Uncharacterized protein n=1 Tax=Fusarium duplospermum TaxID=1325734 RepID=A0A428NSX0_9HYPO|nr:hypothetical protein CEP54_014906 [Fusarium duplospermum]